jgi:protein-arginine kinase activator protein McsA
MSSVSEVESFFEPEKTKYDTYTDEELYKIIDEAVKSEDYEKAAAVRDEIAKRRKKQE